MDSTNLRSIATETVVHADEYNQHLKCN
jgi:hypothetical protein